MLKEGQWQFDVGLNYTIVDHNFTQLAFSGGTSASNLLPLDSRERRQLIEVPLDFRYGFTDRVQGFVDMPVGWANTDVSYLGSDSFYNTGGLGDLNAGVSWLFHKSSDVVAIPI